MNRKRGYVGTSVERLLAFKWLSKVFLLKHSLHVEHLQVLQVTFYRTNDSNGQHAGVKATATSGHEPPGSAFHPGPSHMDWSPGIVCRHLDECTKEWWTPVVGRCTVNGVFRRLTISDGILANFPNIMCFENKNNADCTISNAVWKHPTTTTKPKRKKIELIWNYSLTSYILVIYHPDPQILQYSACNIS